MVGLLKRQTSLPHPLPIPFLPPFLHIQRIPARGERGRPRLRPPPPHPHPHPPPPPPPPPHLLLLLTKHTGLYTRCRAWTRQTRQCMRTPLPMASPPS